MPRTILHRWKSSVAERLEAVAVWMAQPNQSMIPPRRKLTRYVPQPCLQNNHLHQLTSAWLCYYCYLHIFAHRNPQQYFCPLLHHFFLSHQLAQFMCWSYKFVMSSLNEINQSILFHFGRNVETQYHRWPNPIVKCHWNNFVRLPICCRNCWPIWEYPSRGKIRVILCKWIHIAILLTCAIRFQFCSRAGRLTVGRCHIAAGDIAIDSIEPTVEFANTNRTMHTSSPTASSNRWIGLSVSIATSV